MNNYEQTVVLVDLINTCNSGQLGINFLLVGGGVTFDSGALFPFKSIYQFSQHKPVFLYTAYWCITL